MNDTAFELLPLHAVVETSPIPPETKVVPPSGRLNTKTSTVPGRAMSVAVTVATNRRRLVNVVTRNELFQLTMESRGNRCRLGGFSLPSGFNHFTVSTHAISGGRPIHKRISPGQTIDRVAGDDDQAPVEAVVFIGGNRPEEKGG